MEMGRIGYCSSMGRSKDFDQVKAYTYLIRRKEDGLQYYGVRFGNIRAKRTASDDFLKFYWSSGPFRRALRNYPDGFDARLAWTFDSREEAISFERRLLRKIIHRKNWANSGVFPLIPATPEIRQKLSSGKKGEKNPMFGKTGQLSPNYRKTPPEKTKAAVANANRRRVWTSAQRESLSVKRTGKKNPMQGRPRTPEVRSKISRKLRGIFNPNFTGFYSYKGQSFSSLNDLADLVGVSVVTLARWCKCPDLIITDDIVGGLLQHKASFLNYEDVGYSFGDLGFNFFESGRRGVGAWTGKADVSRCRNKFFFRFNNLIYSGESRLQQDVGSKIAFTRQANAGKASHLLTAYNVEAIPVAEYADWKKDNFRFPKS